MVNLKVCPVSRFHQPLFIVKVSSCNDSQSHREALTSDTQLSLLLFHVVFIASTN